MCLFLWTKHIASNSLIKKIHMEIMTIILNTLVNLHVDLRCLRQFAGIYAETKNGGDQ